MLQPHSDANNTVKRRRATSSPVPANTLGASPQTPALPNPAKRGRVDPCTCELREKATRNCEQEERQSVRTSWTGNMTVKTLRKKVLILNSAAHEVVAPFRHTLSQTYISLDFEFSDGRILSMGADITSPNSTTEHFAFHIVRYCQLHEGDKAVAESVSTLAIPCHASGTPLMQEAAPRRSRPPTARLPRTIRAHCSGRCGL